MKCDYCNGTGKWLVMKCPKCGGTGVIGVSPQQPQRQTPVYTTNQPTGRPYVKDYKYLYDMYERNAKSFYETLTCMGYREKDKDGNHIGGSALGTWKSSMSFSSISRNLIEAQYQMRSIREEAMRHGINIPASQYENVSVSMY